MERGGWGGREELASEVTRVRVRKVGEGRGRGERGEEERERRRRKQLAVRKTVGIGGFDDG